MAATVGAMRWDRIDADDTETVTAREVMEYRGTMPKMEWMLAQLERARAGAPAWRPRQRQAGRPARSPNFKKADPNGRKV